MENTFNYLQVTLKDLLSMSGDEDFFTRTFQFYVPLDTLNFENKGVINRSIWVSDNEEYSPKSDIVAIVLHSSTYLPEKYIINKSKKKKKPTNLNLEFIAMKKNKNLITKLKLKPKQMQKEIEKERKRLSEKPFGLLINFKFLTILPKKYVMYRKNGIRSRYSSKPKHFPVIIEDSQLVLQKLNVPTKFLKLEGTNPRRGANLVRKRTRFGDQKNSLLSGSNKTRIVLNKKKKTLTKTSSSLYDETELLKEENNTANKDTIGVENIFELNINAKETFQKPKVIYQNQKNCAQDQQKNSTNSSGLLLNSNDQQTILNQITSFTNTNITVPSYQNIYPIQNNNKGQLTIKEFFPEFSSQYDSLFEGYDYDHEFNYFYDESEDPLIKIENFF
ncbi:hypothetical protein M0812_01825 [Anaeramoeba flamelloides]|uniref:Uncharacterized protein n=1 Tax=Anaeramoeba flamelloides TaxID=1746091 RepID=A0AAV7Z158_9EUKA|nr:hypothetical protein M0812_01825 [Anaeramoeba flamelloides]